MWEHSSHTLRGEGAPPLHPGGFCGTAVPAPTMRALRPAPRPTFSRRESRQRYARNLLVPGPPAKGALPPFDPPAPCPSGIGCDNLNPQTSSGAILPRHGLKVESVPSKEPKEKIKTDLPTRSKWQIGLCLWYKPYRGGAACRRGSEASPSGDSKGHSPWRAFGDFPRDGKVTRVQGGAPALGVWGPLAPTSGSAEGQRPSHRQAESRGEKGGKYKREEPNGSSLLS